MTVQEVPAIAIEGQLGIAPRGENLTFAPYSWLGYHLVKAALIHAKSELCISNGWQSLMVRRYEITI